MIPCYLIEEHNEAYPCWVDLYYTGKIDRTNNYLLHVDHHDDMEADGFESDVSVLAKDTDEAWRLATTDYAIATFIVPAVFQKLFDKVHILKELTKTPIIETKQVLLLRQEKISLLLKMKYIPFLHNSKKDDPDYCIYDLINGGLSDGIKDIIGDRKVVLDIDLDYFCWDDALSTVGPKRIEITKQAYEEMSSNIRHPFNILPARKLCAVQIEDKYYLEYRENYIPDKVASEERILKRINNFFCWLKESGVTPAGIDICTSRFSGYLPAYAYPFVKDEVIKKLEELYDLEYIDWSSKSETDNCSGWMK